LLHRGTEKLIEYKNYLQALPYFDRLDGSVARTEIEFCWIFHMIEFNEYFMELQQYPDPRITYDRGMLKLDTILCGMMLDERWLFYLLQSHTWKFIASVKVCCITCVNWYLLLSSRVYDRDKSNPEGIECSRIIRNKQRMPYKSINTINQSWIPVFHVSV
jgi:hypothetical protein